MAAINVTKNDDSTTNSKIEESDDSNQSNAASTTSTATTATTTSTTSKMKQDSESKSEDKSSKKRGKYSEFTSIYGFYLAIDRRKDSLHSRHNTLEEANCAAKSFLEDIKRRYPDLFCSIYNQSPFEAWTSRFEGTAYLSVKEIEITKCQLDELKVIARRENVSVTRKSKKQLLAILEPIIFHKKHLNEGREIDVRHCKQCQTEHVEEYKKYQKERENNPMVKELKLMEKMYRGTLVNAITENQVRRQYGLTHEDLREGIVSEQLHFMRRCTFGNYYWKFEKAEVIRFARKKKMEKEQKRKDEVMEKEGKIEDAETAETAKSLKKSQKKRGRETLKSDSESVSVPKKRKLKHVRNDKEVDSKADLENKNEEEKQEILSDDEPELVPLRRSTRNNSSRETGSARGKAKSSSSRKLSVSNSVHHIVMLFMHSFVSLIGCWVSTHFV